MPPILTPRLRLRCPEPSDAAPLAAMMTPALSQWLGAWPIPFTLEMATARIDQARASVIAGAALSLVVERTADALPLGWLSIVQLPATPRLATLGYWLGTSHHGQGYLREAAPIAIAAAFQRLPIDTLEASVQPGNAPSIAVLRACNMTYIGERMVPAPARNRDELCAIYQLRRP